MSNYDLLALFATLCGVVITAAALRAGRRDPTPAPCARRNTPRERR